MQSQAASENHAACADPIGDSKITRLSQNARNSCSSFALDISRATHCFSSSVLYGRDLMMRSTHSVSTDRTSAL